MRHWERSIGFGLVHDDLGVDPRNGRVGQKRFLYQPVQVVQRSAIDPQQIIGFSGQGSGADNFRLAGNQLCQSFTVLG